MQEECRINTIDLLYIKDTYVIKIDLNKLEPFVKLCIYKMVFISSKSFINKCYN